MSTPNTTTSSVDPPPLDDAGRRFIETWGRMGSAWGIPRTMAEVHALLFVVGRALPAEAIVEALEISRGNASMTLRRLEEMGIVTRTHRRGDRRDFYEAEQDVWTLFRLILAERKKREIDPLLESLESCRRPLAEGDVVENDDFNKRLDELIDLVGLIDRLSRHVIDPRNASFLRMALEVLDRAGGPAAPDEEAPS